MSTRRVVSWEVVDVRVMPIALLSFLLSMPTPTLAGWFKEPCPKGPDGRCVQVPCEPFLDEMRSLAAYRRKADDPRCPGHAQSSRQADVHQEKIDREQAKMSKECIGKAVAILRPVASIDVQRSYQNDVGNAVALVRYTNNSHRTLQDATISCSAMRDADVVAVGKSVTPGPIPDGSSRDLQVTIELAGAAFSCVQCDLTLER